MKIKQVSCKQFAGIRNKTIDLSDGLNLMIGDNTCGKSTIADLIFCVLFIASDVDLGSSEGKVFAARCFPKNSEGLVDDGVTIDGTLVFEDGGKEYTISKRWDKSKKRIDCELIMPDGEPVRDDAKVRKILDEILKHNAGYYREMVFASQRDVQHATELLFKGKEASKGKKDEFPSSRETLIEIMRKAITDTDGVSLKELETSIIKKDEEYGIRWDYAADDVDIRDRHTNGGKIYISNENLKALTDKLKELDIVHQNIEDHKAKIKAAQDALEGAIRQSNECKKYAETNQKRAQLEGALEDLINKLKELREASENWPRYEAELGNAKALADAMSEAEILEEYEYLEDLYKKLTDTEEELEKMPEVDTDDVSTLKEIINLRRDAESKLAGVNVVAEFTPIGSKSTAEIRYIGRDGEKIKPDGRVEINEGFSIRVPDEFEMVVVPGDVDVRKVRSEIEGYDKDCRRICDKYGVNSLSLLENMAAKRKELTAARDTARDTFEKARGKDSWETWKEKRRLLSPDVKSCDAVQVNIDKLCGTEDIRSFISFRKAEIEHYISKYETIDRLSSKLKTAEEERDKTEEDLSKLDEVPEEFQIDEETLDRSIEEKEQLVKELRAQLPNCYKGLGEDTVNDLREKIAEATAELEENKKIGKRWHKIREVFNTCKESIGNVSVDKIQESFRKYMDKLSDITVTSIDSENQLINMEHGGHRMDNSIMSAGTEDVAALAFRLAVLENSDMDNGMFVVFDDPFVNMDPERTAAAFDLVKDFASDKQVIFFACDSKYLSLMKAGEPYNDVSSALIK